MDVNAIGERVYWLRDERGWTQGELANKSGISTTTISHLENGDIKSVKKNTVRRLARAFDIGTEELIASSDPKALAPTGP